jgi:UDP-glucose 4-epimerase
LASACSGTDANSSKELLQDVLGGAGGVDDDEPLREHPDEQRVAVVRLAQELDALALDPVGRRPHPRRRQLGAQPQKQRHVGQQAVDDREVEVEHTLEPKPARDALIDDRGVEIAVADHDRTPRQGGPDHLVDMLRPRRRVERRLRPRGDVAAVKQEVADRLAERTAARLAREQHLPPVGAQRVGEQTRLGRLAGAVETFKGDKHGRLPSIRGMRAIVTGGAGFIGSNLVDALVEQGHDVHVLDNLSSGLRENVNPRATLHEGDIREDVAAVFASVEPEVCFHLAAQADVGTSVAKPIYDAEVNVLGTLRVLQAATGCGARVVFSSTGGAIYGECDGPADENAARRPISPYGMAKLAAEEYLQGWNRLYGASHTVLRFANVYGPRQMAELEGGVVAIFLERMRDRKPTAIFGDGEQSRDFIYVGDVVRALRAAGERGTGGIYNVGTGRATTVNELHAACRVAARATELPRYEPARPGDVLRSVVDPARLAADLGVRPETNLAEGLALTWASIEKE